MFVERDYQIKARECVFDEWTRVQSTLLEAATGLGKTVIFSNIIKQAMPKRALVLAHRNELIMQAKDKIESVIERQVDIEKAELYADTTLFGKAPVIVSSIQTQCSGPVGNRRYKRFKPEDFSTLIIDEAHRSVSDTYLETIRYYMQNPNLRVLGVTATPNRTDGEALRQVFQSVAFRYGIKDGIDDGWLVDMAQKYVTVKSLDFSEIKTTCGDLNEGELAKVMEAEEIVQGVCQPTIEFIFGLPEGTLHSIPVEGWKTYLSGLGKTPLKTLVFTVSVAQAEMCASVFSRAMDGVNWVHGGTHPKDRKQMLEDFKSGKIHALMNCNVLTEGFDEPGVQLISVARPTKSAVLYQQIIGRGTRPLPGVVDGLETPDLRKKAIDASGKKYIRVLDFAGNSGKHKLISVPDVLGGHVSAEVIERAKKIALERAPGRGALILNTFKEADRQLKHEAAERARIEDEAKKARLLAKSKYSSKDVNAFGPNGEHIPFHGGMKSKDGKLFKENQAKILRELGFDPSNVHFKQGMFLLATKPRPKQLACLKKHGYDTKGLTFKDCLRLMDELIKNGWKKPSTQ